MIFAITFEILACDYVCIGFILLQPTIYGYELGAKGPVPVLITFNYA